MRIQGFLLLCFSASRLLLRWSALLATTPGQKMAAAQRLSRQKKACIRILIFLLFCFSASRFLLSWSSLLATIPGQKKIAERRLSRQKKVRFRIQGFLLLCFSSSASLVRASSKNAWTKDGSSPKPPLQDLLDSRPLGLLASRPPQLPGLLGLHKHKHISRLRKPSNNSYTQKKVRLGIQDFPLQRVIAATLSA